MAEQAKKAIAISDLPPDELIHYGRELGLEPRRRHSARRAASPRAASVRSCWSSWIARRCSTSWSGPAGRCAPRPARSSSPRRSPQSAACGWAGLVIAASSPWRGCADVPPARSRASRRSKRRCGPASRCGTRCSGRRRRVIGSIISRIVDASGNEGEYKFLPEDKAIALPSLKDQITEEGVVGGIARRLRGVADDYVREKLDEIEQRIDRKLDEIDQRLGEWRDREIANRLKNHQIHTGRIGSCSPAEPWV